MSLIIKFNEVSAKETNVDHKSFNTFLGMLLILCIFFTPHALKSEEIPTLSKREATLIGEAYNLWKELGEDLWPGWTRIDMPIFYVGENYEYAIDFPKTLSLSVSLGEDQILKRSIQARNRTFEPNLAASFHVEGIPSAIIGSPEALDWGLNTWVLKVVHEMFHVLQAHRGNVEKAAQLQIGPRDDASWMLDYPFPYKSSDVMRLLHLQGYLMYLAATAAEDADARYQAGTALEAIRVLEALLSHEASGDRDYKYALFQEWNEGIALYSEYKVAEAAGTGEYKPTPAFLALDGALPWSQVWEESYKFRIYLVKHAGRAARSRTTFYHTGLGKGLVLDRLLPEWKNSYFAPAVWLDDLLEQAVGR